MKLSALEALQTGALAATRAAALACQPLVGRGDKKAADAAAVGAMRDTLRHLPSRATVVVGEGEKDDAPMLYAGERLGDAKAGSAIDIAVDPLECTDYCAAGLPGSLATIAMAEPGTMWSPGPGFYMDKLVAGPRARSAELKLTDPPKRTLERLAEVLGKQVEDLRIVVLDKPRHVELIEELRSTGASVLTPTQGDVAGALAAMLPGGGADLLMGVGGTPEGVMTAAAVRAIGGVMQGRLAPQSDEETAALRDAGLDTDRVLEADEMVGGEAFFAATGVTNGPLLRGPSTREGWVVTDSIVVATGAVKHVTQLSPPADGPAGRELANGGTAEVIDFPAPLAN